MCNQFFFISKSVCLNSYKNYVYNGIKLKYLLKYKIINVYNEYNFYFKFNCEIVVQMVKYNLNVYTIYKRYRNSDKNQQFSYY